MNVFLAIVASAAVLLGFATAVLGLVNQSAARRALELADATAARVRNISIQVDGRLSALLERQDQLLGALHESGTPVPPGPPEKTLIPPD